MPNNLDSNVSQIVLKKFLPGFMSDLVLAKTVDRQLLAGEINSSTGDSVSFKRPHQFSSLRTPTGDISGKNKNNLISGKATGRVGNYITVAVEYQQLEEAIKLNQLEKILAPVRQRIVTDLETELAHFMMNNGALSLGSPNTPITKWSDVAQTASFLKDLGVNEGENYAVMDPWSAQRLADAQTGLHASDQLVRTAWENAQIPTNFGGIRALMSNGLASRTQGAFGGTLTVKTQPTVTYNAVKDSYQFTVTLTGATASVTGFLKAGDQVKFTNMMSEWMINPGDIGYAFATGDDQPLPDDESGLPRKYKHAVGYQLLLRMLSDYSLEPTPQVLSNAQRSYDALMTDTLVVPSMRRRGDFPVGQGNKYDVFTSD